MLVKDIMTKNVLTVRTTASIREVAHMLLDHHIAGVPVVNRKGGLAGIVSEGDLLRKEVGPEQPDALCILGDVIYYSGLEEYHESFRKFAARTAEDIMTDKVITVGPDDDVADVARIMLEKKIKRVPVLDHGNLVGIVARADIVRMMLGGDEAGSAGTESDG